MSAAIILRKIGLMLFFTLVITGQSSADILNMIYCSAGKVVTSVISAKICIASSGKGDHIVIVPDSGEPIQVLGATRTSMLGESVYGATMLSSFHDRRVWALPLYLSIGDFRTGRFEGMLSHAGYKKVFFPLVKVDDERIPE